MKITNFLVQGSKQAPYEVVFTRDDGKVSATCTCMAGMEAVSICKHRMAILAGDTAAVVSENHDQALSISGWVIGSQLPEQLGAIKAAQTLVDEANAALAEAKDGLANAKRMLAIALLPKERKKQQKRVPHDSIEFSNTISGINGYAAGWFFLVNAALRPALDILYTPTVRGATWTEGAPPLYQFGPGDSIESRCGQWYVQVKRGAPDTPGKPGSVEIHIYAPNTDIPSLRWKVYGEYIISQTDFVELLKTGKCKAISLPEAV
jgi:hypothetical protein